MDGSDMHQKEDSGGYKHNGERRWHILNKMTMQVQNDEGIKRNPSRIRYEMPNQAEQNQEETKADKAGEPAARGSITHAVHAPTHSEISQRHGHRRAYRIRSVRLFSHVLGASGANGACDGKSLIR